MSISSLDKSSWRTTTRSTIPPKIGSDWLKTLDHSILSNLTHFSCVADIISIITVISLSSPICIFYSPTHDKVTELNLVTSIWRFATYACYVQTEWSELFSGISIAPDFVN